MPTRAEKEQGTRVEARGSEEIFGRFPVQEEPIHGYDDTIFRRMKIRRRAAKEITPEEYLCHNEGE